MGDKQAGQKEAFAEKETGREDGIGKEREGASKGFENIDTNK